MKTDDRLLMKYMQGLCTEKEKDAIDRWLTSSEENRKAFRDAHHIYEGILMSAGPESLRFSARGGRPERSLTIFRIALAAASFAAAVAITASVSTAIVRRSLAGEMLSVEVPAGKMMTLTLNDGTKVDLNSGSKISYPAVFFGRQRTVSLEGEAMFHVSHDREHPFVVKTFAADISVLGTEFSVNADSAAGEFSASLVNGLVRVTESDDPSCAWLLKPDQTISLRDGRFLVEEMLDPQTLYWPEGLINISDISFSDLMKRLEKAYGIDIVILMEKMPEINCTSGEIRISDGIVNALKVLRHIADFDYERDNVTGTIYIKES